MSPTNQTAPEIALIEQSLQDLFGNMEVQRLQAIKTYWFSLGKTLALLPLCLLPALLFLPYGDGPVLQALSVWLVDTLQLNAEANAQIGMALSLAALVWFMGGLYLLGRYFTRRGRQPVWQFLQDYKDRVFTQVCELAFTQLRYHPNQGIGWQRFDDSQLFPWVSDWYRSDDYFAGKVGQTDICFAEATAKRERKRLAKDGFDRYLDTYFQGIVFIADFHKHFHSTTRIIPAGEKIKRITGQQQVQLEDPEFEALFTTTSTDQIDARYVLSTSMMQRLVQLHRRFANLRILFHNEQMLMLLPSAGDKFEPALYRRANNLSQVTAFIRDVRNILPVVEELNLNLRIWSKS